jgi:hypothetical protein
VDEFSSVITQGVHEVDAAMKSLLSARAQPRRQSQFCKLQKNKKKEKKRKKKKRKKQLINFIKFNKLK